MGSAILRDYLNTTICSADDVERWLNLPALAVIPSVKGWRRNRLRHGNGVSKLFTAHTSGNPELLIDADPRSPLAEAYRKLRTSMLLSSLGNTLKHGADVLIIDADMRSSRLHSIFELDNEQGLSTVLSGEAIEGDIASLFKLHEASGLHVLTAGPAPLNPAELLGSEQMRYLLAKAESMFSHIIIDSPPVLAVSDSAIVSPIADGVLLVVQSNKVSRDAVRQSLKLLHIVDARVIGVVLNNVSDPNSVPSLFYKGKYLVE
jgi:capsular exopolysaccharide synthesis family protein